MQVKSIKRVKNATAILIGLLMSGLATLPGVTLRSSPALAAAGDASARSDTYGDLAKRTVMEAFDKLALQFEQVRDRRNSQVKFAARARGLDVGIMPAGAVMQLSGAKDVAISTPAALSSTRATVDELQSNAVHSAATPRSEPAVMRMELVGANRRARVVGEEQMPAQSNYFIGNNASRWRTGVTHYGRIRVKQAYRGVDVVYYGTGKQLEYDVEVAPGADFKAIRLRFTGARRVWVDGTGDLLIETRVGTLRNRKPNAYQQINGARKGIDANYVLDDRNGARFALGNYDKGLPVIIDPVLAYSSFFGGAEDDAINGVALDSSGYVYVAGTTESSDLPTTPGSFQPHKQLASELGFIVKFDLTNNALIYSTYLGGSKGTGFVSTHCNAIAVDSLGNAYVTGRTNATDFPITSGDPMTLIGLTNNQITAIANPHAAGNVNVVANNPDGQNAVLSNGYAYLSVQEIQAVEIENKVLEVAGPGFDKGAIILVDGVPQETQQPLSTLARLLLFSRKAAKKIAPGQAVMVQVRNANGLLSESFRYVKPAG